jgi:hypothetical protein
MRELLGEIELDDPPVDLTLGYLQRLTGLRVVGVRHLCCWGHEYALRTESEGLWGRIEQTLPDVQWVTSWDNSCDIGDRD